MVKYRSYTLGLVWITMHAYGSIDELGASTKQTKEQQELTIDAEGLELLERAWSVNTVGNGVPSTAPQAYYSLRVNGRHLRGHRPWDQRWNMIKDATLYKGKRTIELGCCMGLASTYLKRYCGTSKSVLVDASDYILQQQGSPLRFETAKWVARAFGVEHTFVQLDFNKDNYEEILGYNHDIAIVMSIIKWVENKDRFMRYIAHFDEVIFEGHESDAVEIGRFVRYGFDQHIILGVAKDKNRTVIHFSKSKNKKKSVQRVERIAFDDIDFQELTIVKTSRLKNGTQRVVYKQKDGSLFYKIWPKTYSRIADFVSAVHAGFYDKLAQLVALIYDETGCRGYITRAGTSIISEDSGILFERVPGNLNGRHHEFVFLADTRYQTNRAYKKFYHTLLTETKRTGFFYFDLQPHNLVKIDGELYLVDLEPVAPLRDLRDEFYETFYNPREYREMIRARHASTT